MDEFYTVRQIATELKVDRETVRRWLQDGKLTGTKPYRDWLVSRDELERFRVEREKGKGQ